MAFCSQCGSEKPDSGVCPVCNAASAAPPPPPPPPSPPPPPPPPPQQQWQQPPQPEPQQQWQQPPQPAQPQQQWQQPPQPAQPQQQWQQPQQPVPQQQWQQQSQYHQPPMHQQGAPKGFMGDVLSKTFGFIFKKPFLLWGLCLLCNLLMGLATIFGLLPIIYYPINAVLFLGIVNIFLCGYRGQHISTDQLFEGFEKGKFLRNACGLGWAILWILIWAMIPIAGPFIATYKFYQYLFVPFIMLEDPDISPNDALKKSMRITEGYKGKMFLTNLLIGICLSVAGIIFWLLVLLFFSLAPAAGVIFLLLGGLVSLGVALFAPLFIGTLYAVYWDKISKENPVQ